MLPLYAKNGLRVCGCDEAGRGPLAGPVVAAAVILPEGFHAPLLDDSKKLNAARRNALRIVIEAEAVSYGVGILDHRAIDEHNILKASFLAMHAAIAQLDAPPDFIIVDGNRFLPYNFIPYECVVKGDGKYAEIAAASILAKTVRDGIMEELHQQYPMYGWDTNKGYPTAAHRVAIAKHGPSPYHRQSFRW